MVFEKLYVELVVKITEITRPVNLTERLDSYDGLTCSRHRTAQNEGVLACRFSRVRSNFTFRLF